MLCMCVTVSKFQNEKKNLSMKRKAPDLCDQSRSVIKVRKTENKSRDKWFSSFLITNHLACNSIMRI